MASCTSLHLHLYCRLVLHCRTSSPGVIFLRSLKLFVDPAKNTCRLPAELDLDVLADTPPFTTSVEGIRLLPLPPPPGMVGPPPCAITSRNEWSTTTSDDARHGRSTTTSDDAWHGRSTTTSNDARHRHPPSATSWYGGSHDVDAAGPQTPGSAAQVDYAKS